MSTPQSTPVRHVKLSIVSTKSLPLTNEYKRLLGDQHQRLTLKHQQDLDLLDDIRSYVKSRLSIEKDYTNALQKLAKQHANHISKKFALLAQLDQQHQNDQVNSIASSSGSPTAPNTNYQYQNQAANQSQSQGSRYDETGTSSSAGLSSLYKVWSEHIQRLATTSKNRSNQFDHLNLVVDKLKDIRQHKASIGKRCLDTHLKRIQEELLLSMLDVERAKKLYYADESQAKKARENEERIKKKRTGLLTKFTDLQAKKEKSSAQREATDIQSTQARNDYIMALAAANAHLKYYYHKDLNDFIHLIDDGVLDHCKIFMATLSECDINSLKDSLTAAQSWAKLINLTGSQQTNHIFLECEQSKCLRTKQELAFEPCNEDPISKISLEHNADYALQHEIDKWFTWFKKECRNFGQLLHQLDTCQHALAEGKKSIELNGQTIEDLEPRIIELKQQIRKCEAAKLKAQARLKVIKEGGMQIEEWSAVESEIRADMARALEEEQQQRACHSKEMRGAAKASQDDSSGAQQLSGDGGGSGDGATGEHSDEAASRQGGADTIKLQVSRDSDSSGPDVADSSHNLASVSRSTSNLMQKQQNAMTGYSALTDPSLVWQDDYSQAWAGTSGVQSASQMASSSSFIEQTQQVEQTGALKSPGSQQPASFEHSASSAHQVSSDKTSTLKQQQIPNAAISIQSSSPLSAIVNGGQHLSQSPYQGIMSEAYKSDYECDYTRTGQQASIRSAASSVEPITMLNQQTQQHELGDFSVPSDLPRVNNQESVETNEFHHQEVDYDQVTHWLNKRVMALYTFEKSNEDDLAFSEGDVLLVIETNSKDPDWIKAQSETSGEQGFIPSSYVRLLEDNEQLATWTQNEKEKDEFVRESQANSWQPEVSEINQAASESAWLCVALYDYTPDADTFEDDGLPHLALKQGELMRIIDQGEDDGWWLVEKQDASKTRGHVPSMLVDEVDEDVDVDDGEVSQDDESERSELEDGPITEPPALAAPELIEESVKIVEKSILKNERLSGEEEVDEAQDERVKSINCDINNNDNNNNNYNNNDKSSLIPTSFIIIEPTPEVESRRFEDNLVEELDDDDNAHKTITQAQEASFNNNDITNANENENENENEIENNEQAVGGRRVVGSKLPPNQVSYSVVNEDFVLEKPTRKAYQHTIGGAVVGSTDGPSHHHEPTIMEEDSAQLAEVNKSTAKTLQEEPVQMDFSNMPAPPEVVIDVVEAIPRSPDLSFDHLDDDDDDHKRNGHDLAHSSDNDEQSRSSEHEPSRKEMKHSGFVDVSPILRHHADEFCRQLIEEAIMLAPGSHIGPSTSSASVSESVDGRKELEDENEEDEGDDNEHKGSFEST